MVLSPGYMLGHYEIRSLLDKGGMGEVYLAHDINLRRRRVAIKLLPVEFTQDKDRLSRFEREADAASSLNHPNIITIHEIGEQDGHHYIATEYVEGENLSQHMAHTRMMLREVLGVASQIASALAAAHQARVVHRDIKPQNIMLRSDGYIKVLDFGLAKLASRISTAGREEVDREAPTLIRKVDTESGMIVGTPSYMSPEQARGLEVDARADIWSLGVVIYEMVAGRLPFEGVTLTDVLTKVLHHEPPSLMLYSSEVPAELERIVEKALTKDREERYQLAKELSLDLNRLKQHLDLEAELERSVPPDGAGPESKRHEAGARVAAPHESAVTAAGKAAQGASSDGASWTGNIVGKLKRHKKVAALVLTAFGIAAFLVGLYYRQPDTRLTGKDQILLADFDNVTGDAVFDGGTLKRGLIIQLSQSPFINVVPDVRVGDEMLPRMGRSKDERVTKDVARVICERYGIKAFVVGSISKFGSTYMVTLEAFKGKNGELITAPVQQEASSIEQVPNALTQAARTLRGQLGESLASIEKFDVPLDLTVRSLPALKAFSQGYELSLRGNHEGAIELYLEATKLDPKFPYAYSGLAAAYNNTNKPESAAENARKAFEQSELTPVSQLEKYRINHIYYSLGTGELKKAIDELVLYKQTYPNDYRAPSNLSDRYLASGQFKKAEEEARAALQLNPDAAPSNGNLGLALLGLGQFDDAREVCERALQRSPNAPYLHTILYQVAFVKGDNAAMEQQLTWARNNGSEFIAKDWQTQAAAFAGRWGESSKLSREAVKLAGEKKNAEAAAQYEVDQALRGAVFGQCAETSAGVKRALGYGPYKSSFVRGAIALNLCGDTDEAQIYVAELEKRFDKDTLLKDLWLPTIRAAAEINRNPDKAIGLLDTARQYETAAEFWPQYLRGLAYLQSNQNEKAAAEFQKILDTRGQSAISILHPLASLNLARAAARAGDKIRSRKSYSDFLTFWEKADSDIPLLLSARQEYVKVK